MQLTPLSRGRLRSFLPLASLLFLLGACAETNMAATVIKEITPPPSGTYKVGSPYEINGVWYYPKENPNYDEQGIASWYGEPFHGRTTANGEVFDMNELTAAHKTLPMPVYVRATNLENGRSLVLRVNDRGPFVSGRIIDVSRRAAQLLGFQLAGTARVRVQIVDYESGLTYAEQGAVPPAPEEEIVPAPEVVLTEREISGETYVQVGAYGNADNAYVVSEALTDVGEVQIQRVVRGEATLYRVRLGPYDDAQDAELIRRAVEIRGYPEATVVEYL